VPRHRLRNEKAGVSLRRRLVVGMLVLLVVGLITTDVVTFSSLRSFLLGRLDEQVDAWQNQAYSYIYQVYARDVRAGDGAPISTPQAWLAELRVSPPNSGGFTEGVAGSAPRLNPMALSSRLSSDAYVEVFLSDGKLVFRDPSGLPRPDPAPILPRSLPVEHAPPPHVFGTKHGPYAPESPSVDVPAAGTSGTQYRLQAVTVPGGTLVTGISLDPTDKTLASLTHVEILVSIVVMIALLALALWIVRLGMRPLDDMTETAGAIARGDLTRRIRWADDHSEVGRLGTALNGMLSQIEAAFRERTGSEARLRRFVADASHELRTPLTSIRGYAELLRKGAFDDEESRRRAAERIEGEAARMSLLVDDLLLLARLDQGRPLDFAPLDLGSVVAEAVEAVKLNEPKRSITLDIEGPVQVRGDAARLRQIADNLVRNAVVHTPAGTAVHVSVTRRDDLVVLEVADEGRGLDAEQAARVFDRFYRGSEARTGEGTGLGLSIVAALAEAHGGRATLRSEPGRGATFTVEIPTLRSASHEAPVSPATQVPAVPAGREATEAHARERRRDATAVTPRTDDEALAPGLRH
jgi:two-component system, OmpR family, sensor kinase